MKSIALQIFKVCNRIDYIVGTPQNTKSGDLVPAFNAFARELKSGNPVSAAIRATGAVNCHFICHDRQELQVELNFEVLHDGKQSRRDGTADLCDLSYRAVLTAITDFKSEIGQGN